MSEEIGTIGEVVVRDTAAEGEAPPQTPTPRRRSRGGRGRGGRGGGGRAKPPETAGGEPAGAAEATEPEAEADRAPEHEPDSIPGDVTSAPAPRKRRRRGGRGRGTKKPAQQGDDDGAAEGEDDAETSGAPKARAGTAAPRPSQRRRSVPATVRSTGTVRTEPDDGGATAEPEVPAEQAESTGAEAPSAPRKRRRRGGRGRGRKPAQPAEEVTAPDGAEEAPEPAPASARRGRRQPQAARESTPPDAAKAPKEPKPRKGSSAPARSKEPEEAREAAPVSTRLGRARQSRQSRPSSRRRRELMPVVPRVTDKLMVITEHGERDQLAVLEGRDLVQHYVTRIGARSMVGNVYLGRVQNVLPGMEAAFIDVGRGRNAVLYAGEVNYAPEDLDGSPPRIEKVLKSGQSVLVQVTKDPIGGKGARLTAQISMPGRYLVLVPNSNVTGISRRLSEEERKRLKAVYKKIRPEAHGLIVRTAADGASEDALAADLSRLLEEWAAIEKRAKKAKAPAILYEEPELTVRVVRDLFTDEEFRELVTDSPRVYEVVTDYLRQTDPDVVSKVRLHEGKLPAFEEFHIVEQIHKGLDRKVWLPSGGYIVIDRTEALTVIDVNTGKSVGKTNLEETVVNTNLEASREVARQLRLRDIGGMIVIDFIDMLLEQNKRKVIDTLREALAQDKSRSQVFDISPLGLLEVTRKRVSGGLLESFSETCPTCEGRGVLLTYDVD